MLMQLIIRQQIWCDCDLKEGGNGKERDEDRGRGWRLHVREVFGELHVWVSQGRMRGVQTRLFSGPLTESQHG